MVAAAAVRPSFVLAMAEASNGEIWLGTRDAGLLRVQGTQVTPVTSGLPDPKVNCLLPGENGELWIGTDRGLARRTGREVTTTGIPECSRTCPRWRCCAIVSGNIWIAADARGLLRVSGGRVPASTPGTPAAAVTSRPSSKTATATSGSVRHEDRAPA